MACLNSPVRLLVLLLLFTASPQLQADWALNMPQGVTEVSRSIFDLHMTIFLICVAIGVVVFGMMLWSIIRYRKSQGAKPSQFHESTTVEIIWTLLPFAILIAMAVPATKTLVQMYEAGDADLDIQITGYQWKWKYDYLGENVSFFSNLATPREQIRNEQAKQANYLLEVDEPLVVPVNQKVRFLITANDVIHSWWVPDFAVKKDAIPGFINEAWVRIEQPGVYRGQCAELCGVDHGFMPIVVQALSETDYQDWLASKQQQASEAEQMAQATLSLDELMSRGETLYNTYCAACHQVDGTGMPPTFPGLKDSTIALGPVEDHIDIVVNGKPGTAMAAFGEQLSPLQLAAIITYERNAWGNDTGDAVQAADVQAWLQE